MDFAKQEKRTIALNIKVASIFRLKRGGSCGGIAKQGLDIFEQVGGLRHETIAVIIIHYIGVLPSMGDPLIRASASGVRRLRGTETR